MATASIGTGLRARGKGVTRVAGEFRTFVLRGNVVELAVGIVIGVAFGAVITALVKDLITPLIAAIGAQPNFGGLTVTVNHSRLLYGDFINALLSFVIVAAVIFFLVVLPMNRMTAFAQRNRATAAPTTRPCSECLSPIPLAAHRCAHCATPQTPVESGA